MENRLDAAADWDSPASVFPHRCHALDPAYLLIRRSEEASSATTYEKICVARHFVSAFPGSATNTGVEAMSRKNSCWRIKTRIADPGSSGISQLAPPISRASSERTYPGGLPLRERTSSQPSLEPTTLILVPRS